MTCDGCGWCEGSPAWECYDCEGTGVEHFKSVTGKRIERTKVNIAADWKLRGF